MAGAAERNRRLEHSAQVARLISKAGEPPREHRILGKRALIGSGGEADFVLMDTTISRRHALIEKSHGRFLISDLGSTNGTLIKGKRLAPNSPITIANNEEIQFGALHFSFVVPKSTQDELRYSFETRTRIQGLLTVLLIAAIVAAYFLPRSFWDALWPVSKPKTAAVSSAAPWIARLNYYRQLAHLAPVTEDAALSSGDANHARYLVANNAAMIRSGKIDASIHDEDPAKPLFTPEGKNAGAASDVDAVFTDPPETPDGAWAIENWITGPFHRMWMLNPALHQVGYGQYCSGGICAAALNIRSGIGATPQTVVPVMFPPDRATIKNAIFSAEEAEWPDPLASCGYSTPSGIPITLQTGGTGAVTLEQFSLSRNGTAAESCAFDASSYKSADLTALDRVHQQLTHFGAVVMVPKQPLAAGATYTVAIRASGESYSWWFSVEP